MMSRPSPKVASRLEMDLGIAVARAAVWQKMSVHQSSLLLKPLSADWLWKVPHSAGVFAGRHS
jgi:hypothetical protein